MTYLPAFLLPPGYHHLFISLQVEMTFLGSSIMCLSHLLTPLMDGLTAFFLRYQDIFVMRYTKMKKKLVKGQASQLN